MSTKNVSLFLEAISEKTGLMDRLANTEATAESWVRIAVEDGYDFTAPELRSVIEQTLGRDLGTDNPVHEYLTAQDLMGRHELSKQLIERLYEKELEKVSGGIQGTGLRQTLI